VSNPTPYIVRRAPQNGAKVRHYISYGLNVSRIDETRSTGRSLGGLFREVESTGRKIKGILRIATKDGLTLDGHGQGRSHSEHVRITPAAEIKKVVRRARPEELEAIAEVDVVIADLEARLKEARAARAELVSTAWTKGHAVTAKELEELADAPRAERAPMTAADREALARTHDELRRAFGTG
jgi:hypothetical protein